MADKLELDQMTRSELTRIANDLASIKQALGVLAYGPEQPGGRGARSGPGLLKLLERLVEAVEAPARAKDAADAQAAKNLSAAFKGDE
jgi:hypothetical protein